jgi:hypothetical protein
MKIKSWIAPMECPEKYWLKSDEMDMPEDLPEDIVEEVLEVWPKIESGKAINREAKKKMIELHNTIYGTKFSTGTNCSSCLNSCFEGTRLVYEKYK